MTERHNFVVEAALDSLTRVLAIDCSWIQLARPISNELDLVSSRNFTYEIRYEISQMDMNHCFAKEVLGLGNRVIIPNLGTDGRYGMAMFEKAGFYSLIAVPIMTYKTLGILGAAYKSRKKFNNDFAQLFAVIANLVGMSLSKNIIPGHTVLQEDGLPSSGKLSMRNNEKGNTEESTAVIDRKVGAGLVHQSEDRKRAFNEKVSEIIAFLKSYD